MARALFAFLHALQAAFSAYTLYLSSISIRNLQKYEETSKKAAKYSNIAEHQLHKTRTTQASGALAILFSFLCSLTSTIYLLLFPGVWMTAALGIAGANVVVLELARRHLSAFWEGKAKVPLPGVGEYNEAIGKTQEMKLNMAYLIASWATVGVLRLLV